MNILNRFERRSDRRLSAIGLVNESLDASRLFGEVQKADIDRLAELLQGRTRFLDPVEQRAAPCRAAGAVLHVHALAGVAQEVQDRPGRIGVSQFDDRSDHRQCQRGHGGQPQRQQHTPVELRQVPHARRIGQQNERNQTGHRGDHGNPRPDGFDNHAHGKRSLVFRCLFRLVETVGDEMFGAENGDDDAQNQGKHFLPDPTEGDVPRQALDGT